MLRGERLPGDQDEVVVSDDVVDWITANVPDSEREAFFDDVVSLFEKPSGKHPLSNRSAGDPLAGLNTMTTLGGAHRVGNPVESVTTWTLPPW